MHVLLPVLDQHGPCLYGTNDLRCAELVSLNFDLALHNQFSLKQDLCAKKQHNTDSALWTTDICVSRNKKSAY